MKVKATESIKQATFYGMLKYSLLFFLVVFVTLSTFGVSISYLLVKSSEKDLANLLSENIEQKEVRMKEVSKDISKLMASDISDDSKKIALEFKLQNEIDISGVLILDENGYVTDSSEEFKTFRGYDFSHNSFYERAMGSSDTVVSEPFLSSVHKKFSLSFTTPYIDMQGKKKFAVLLMNPYFIDETDKVESLKYSIVTKNGDVVFTNRNDHIQLIDSIVIKNIRDNNFKTFIHKDQNTEKYVLTTVRADGTTFTYAVVQHYIFNNSALINGIIIIGIVNIALILILIFIFSIKVSNIITGYINILFDEMTRVEKGIYDISNITQYPYKEVNEFMRRFCNMEHKVNQREQELLMYNEELRASNDEIIKMIETINKNEKEKQEQYIEIMHTLLNLIEIKDEYTAGHSKMVTFYTTKIIKVLNSSYGFNLDLEKIRVAAILHDIGKIGISSEILNKSSNLTEEEYHIIKSHSEKGYLALKNVKNLKEESIMVKHHHERYDGRGYPDGLKGNDIPLGARIICVADSYDAMTSDRPYRKGIPMEEAIAELRKNKGSQFDPFIVEVFVSSLINEEVAITEE